MSFLQDLTQQRFDTNSEHLYSPRMVEEIKEELRITYACACMYILFLVHTFIKFIITHRLLCVFLILLLQRSHAMLRVCRATDLSLHTIKCCSVVFGVTSTLLVTHISSSSHAINKLRRLLPAISVTTCHGLAAPC